MNYYYDCEFLEGSQKEDFPISLFRKNTPPTIDLISIGIVAEDGREYYAISKDFNLKEAWNRYDVAPQTQFEKQSGFDGRKIYWIRENVLKPIWIDLSSKSNSGVNLHKLSPTQNLLFTKAIYESGEMDSFFNFKNFQKLITKHGKSNKQIAEEVIDFCATKKNIFETDGLGQEVRNRLEDNPVNLYGYYSAYDHVVFCWLFGKMIDLPKGFPMYTRDLKQMMDEITYLGNVKGLDLNLKLSDNPNYPKQENEHSAIDDARWNKKLHEFINSL